MPLIAAGIVLFALGPLPLAPGVFSGVSFARRPRKAGTKS
jgi:hypothetical protein